MPSVNPGEPDVIRGADGRPAQQPTIRPEVHSAGFTFSVAKNHRKLYYPVIKGILFYKDKSQIYLELILHMQQNYNMKQQQHIQYMTLNSEEKKSHKHLFPLWSLTSSYRPSWNERYFMGTSYIYIMKISSLSSEDDTIKSYITRFHCGNGWLSHMFYIHKQYLSI